jgi:hypothetical protein
MSTTIYISIGNSDDKLSQAEWAEFYRRTNLAIRNFAQVIHGQWVSEPASAWQNACWCIEIETSSDIVQVTFDFRGASRTPDRYLREALAEIAGEYRQDSIAWAPATTEFLAAVDA